MIATGHGPDRPLFSKEGKPFRCLKHDDYEPWPFKSEYWIRAWEEGNGQRWWRKR